jgi:hypothetical protein
LNEASADSAVKQAATEIGWLTLPVSRFMWHEVIATAFDAAALRRLLYTWAVTVSASLILDDSSAAAAPQLACARAAVVRRGPIWMPVNALLIRGLVTLRLYDGDDFTIECPTGSGRQMNLWQVAEEISHRLSNIFLRDAEDRRPVYGETEKFQADPQWRDYVLFYGYFHGDNGAGIGASHQTGWTGLIAELFRLFGTSASPQRDLVDRLIQASG